MPKFWGYALTPLVILTSFYSAPTKKNIVIFDKDEVISQFIRQLAEVKATESQVEQATRRFNLILNQILVDTAQQNKVIILKTSEVLGGGVDITDEVRTKLTRAMRMRS